MLKITKGNFAILENRNFLKLWFSQVLSQPASSMLNFILVIKIFEISSSNFIVSLLVALVSVPPILFSSTAGVLADSFNRKQILVISNLLRAVIVVGLIFFGESYYSILILAFLVSLVSVFFSPAETASIPTLTKNENLFAANSLFLFTLYTSFLIGYSLGGPLLYWMGKDVYYVLIVCYLLATIMDTLLPPLNYHLQEKREQLGRNLKNSFNKIWNKIREGVEYIKHYPLLLVTILQITFVFSAERAIIALVPDFATNILNFNTSQIGYFLIAPVGLGALMGALIANRLKRKFSRRKIISIGILIDAITLTLLPLYSVFEKYAINFAYASYFYWLLIFYIAILAFFSGLADVAIIVSAQTMLQEATHNEKRGRVFGNSTMLMNLVGLPLVLLVGYLATYISVSKIIFVIGLATILVAFLSIWMNRKRLDPIHN